MHYHISLSLLPHYLPNIYNNNIISEFHFFFPPEGREAVPPLPSLGAGEVKADFKINKGNINGVGGSLGKEKS